MMASSASGPSAQDVADVAARPALLQQLQAAFDHLREEVATTRAQLLRARLEDHCDDAEGPLVVDRSQLVSLLGAVDKGRTEATEGDRLIVKHAWVGYWWRLLRGDMSALGPSYQADLLACDMFDGQTRTRPGDRDAHQKKLFFIKKNFF